MFRIVTIIGTETYEREIDSRRVAINGDVLITGSPEGVSDTLARMFSMIEEMRRDIEADNL